MLTPDVSRRNDGPASLDGLPAPLAAEVDRVCDEFERDWRQAVKEGRTSPDPTAYLARVPQSAQPALVHYLREAERGLKTSAPLPDLPGYELLERIGGGGMGVVYKARDRAVNRLVAVKVIDRAELVRSPRQRVLWKLDGEVVAGLRHPNVVAVEKLGEHDGEHYLVMPLVEGKDLKQRRAEFLLAGHEPGAAGRAERAVKIALLLEKVARAVHYVHVHGVFHRDLKPSNILLNGAGEPLVCDFGLARRVEESLLITLSGQMIGTPPYMAPEQMAQEHEARQALTLAVDIWALGAILYELLSGRPPFMADNPGLAELMRRKRDYAEPPALAGMPGSRIATDSDLEWICLKCLQRDPADRFGSAEQLADALRRYQERKRVRPSVPLGRKLLRWLRPFARPPVDPDYMDRWRNCLRAEATTSFVAHAGMFFLARLHPTGGWLWLWFLTTDTFLGWLLWLPMMRTRRLSPMAEAVAQLWSGADLAVVVLFALFCPFFGAADPEVVGRFYAAYAVIRGLLFFIEGRMCWGRLYLVGFAFYAAAVVMSFVPEYAPLIHGTTYSAGFVWLSFQRWTVPEKAATTGR